MSGTDERLYSISAEAQNDLFEIWRRIADDSVELADRIEREFHELFASLGRTASGTYSRRSLQASCSVFLHVLVFDRVSAGREAHPHHGRTSRQA
ncbi:MAG: type II toxin-antitoxin system RelE/ParE family toxin [Bryobacteraceae bacterium]